MKTIFLTIISLFLVSCSSMSKDTAAPNKDKISDVSSKRSIFARITAYWPGEDKWTSKGKTSTGRPLESRKTAAIDPKVIPYGSTIHIPSHGLKLVAADTGSAVKSRRASRRIGRNEPIIDIYFKTKSEAKLFLSKLKSPVVKVYF